MSNYVRNCSNCFWNISSSDVDEILMENHYKADDPDYPNPGCGLTDKKRWGDNYYCKEHSYIDGIIDTYVLYDEEYLGPGYFIIGKLDDEIAMFAKFYEFRQTIPFYHIRAYEKGAVDLENKNFRNIDIPISLCQSKTLYDAVKRLQKLLNKKSIVTSDQSKQGKSQFKIFDNGSDILLSFSKDIDNVKDATDFVDISIGDSVMYKQYDAMNQFYKQLSSSVIQECGEKDIVQKILKMTT